MRPHSIEKELPALLSRAEHLPSLPAVALEVLRIAQDEDARLDDLAACLSRDPALAAKLLKLANSSLFRTGKPVSTLQRATMLLGTKTVKLMALSFSLTGTLPRHGKRGSFDFGEYWQRSLACAIAARSIARRVRSPHADEAFLCGLFAHFGKLVLMRCLPVEYEGVVAEAGGWPSALLEEERLGFRNTDVCAALLKSWGLPELIHVTVGAWARPEERERLEAEERQLAQLVLQAHLAESVLCNAEKGSFLARLHEEMLRLHGIPAGEVDALLVGLETGVGEAAELLSVQLPSDTSYEEIIDLARMQIVHVSLGTAVDLATAERRNRELESEKSALASRASTDKLTGLPNRATFDAFLEKELEARRAGSVPRALGLLMIDIDRFKRCNDTYGHQAGDEVLRRVGAQLARMTRRGDLAARYGGEEFAVVIAQTNPSGLKTVAERLRAAIEREVIEFDGKTISVTASFGGACLARSTDASDAAALVKVADQHLYRAKERGRNRCEVHEKSNLSQRG